MRGSPVQDQSSVSPCRPHQARLSPAQGIPGVPARPNQPLRCRLGQDQQPRQHLARPQPAGGEDYLQQPGEITDHAVFLLPSAFTAVSEELRRHHQVNQHLRRGEERDGDLPRGQRLQSADLLPGVRGLDTVRSGELRGLHRVWNRWVTT